jgi:hypothetical protein
MIWFFLCTGYIFAWIILRANRGWIVAISLSGYSTAFVVFLICFFLFAVYHRLGKAQIHKLEHPLTSTGCYGLCYNISSFIGALAGVLAAISTAGTSNYPLLIAAGSFLVTFVVWLILDPLLAAAEMLLPQSRQNRAIRLAKVKEMRQNESLAKKHALEEAETSETEKLKKWDKVLEPNVKELAALSITSPAALEQSRGRIVDIGIGAWQMGGLGCMRHLHSMAVQTSRQDSRGTTSMDLVSACWDGIGNW